MHVLCVWQTFVYANNLYFQPNPFTTPVQVTDNRGEKYVYNGICDWLYEGTFVQHWFLADRTATQYDRLLASSCCPSVCPSVCEAVHCGSQGWCTRLKVTPACS